MTETRFDPPHSEAPGDRWGKDPERPRPVGPDPALHRFLGGAPAAVLLRLLLVSIVVGAVLMWLRLRPIDILLNFEDLVQRLWHLGFQSLHEIGDYIVAGAVIVVPVWLVIRLLNFRNPR